MPNQNMTQHVNEAIENVLSIIRFTRGSGLHPMACVINPDPEHHPECAVFCLYAAEYNPPADKLTRTMPLTPYFYHYSVASQMVALGLMTEAHVSQRTGVQVHWCEFTDKAR